MKGFRGCRVLVVDDDLDEAVPILKALAKAGIGSVFFDGHLEETPAPEERLRGIRLAILDLDLSGGGTPGRSKATALVGLLERVVAPDNGPYAVVLWTKHTELRDEFENILARSTVPKPMFVDMLEKGNFRVDGAFQVGPLFERARAGFVGASPLAFFQTWEGAASDSATEVTNALSQLATATGGDAAALRAQWQSQMLRMLHALASASAGEHLTPANAIEAAVTALNPIHSDQMEQAATTMGVDLAQRAIDIMAAADCSAEQKAHIDAMIHLGPVAGSRLLPGVVCTCAKERLQELGVRVQDLIPDIILSDRDEVERQALPVLLEVSAACDHAQKNVRSTRFIGGLILPATLERCVKKKTAFIHRGIPPLYLRDGVANPGVHHLVLSARHAVSFAAGSGEDLSSQGLTVRWRLRLQALGSVQAWLAAQATRPGIITLGHTG